MHLTVSRSPSRTAEMLVVYKPNGVSVIMQRQRKIYVNNDTKFIDSVPQKAYNILVIPLKDALDKHPFSCLYMICEVEVRRE